MAAAARVCADVHVNSPGESASVTDRMVVDPIVDGLKGGGATLRLQAKPIYRL